MSDVMKRPDRMHVADVMDLTTSLGGGLILKNPVTVASGTYGFGREYAAYMDISKLGAISVKGLTLEAQEGNPGIRVVETPMGMLNSVGLQNPGVHAFIREELPFLKAQGIRVLANINGNSIEAYREMASILSETDVDAIELNISCPNVKNGGLAFGTDPKMVSSVVGSVRQACTKPLIVKLSPNVTDIACIAQAAEAAGADSISLINTVTGMAIDIHRRVPMLRRGVGGLSGPAVRPIAVRMVYVVRRAVKIPILGMGGIATAEDAIEFILAGAQAIAVGTACFSDPLAPIKILEGIKAYMAQYGYTAFQDLVGAMDEMTEG